MESSFVTRFHRVICNRNDDKFSLLKAVPQLRKSWILMTVPRTQLRCCPHVTNRGPHTITPLGYGVQFCLHVSSSYIE
jgi:hypothetical protein